MINDRQHARALKIFIEVLDLFLEHLRQRLVLKPDVVELVAQHELALFEVVTIQLGAARLQELHERFLIFLDTQINLIGLRLKLLHAGHDVAKLLDSLTITCRLISMLQVDQSVCQFFEQLFDLVLARDHLEDIFGRRAAIFLLLLRVVQVGRVIAGFLRLVTSKAHLTRQQQTGHARSNDGSPHIRISLPIVSFSLLALSRE